jgi:hypothetical protein
MHESKLFSELPLSYFHGTDLIDLVKAHHKKFAVAKGITARNG